LQTARRSANAWIVDDPDEYLADREGRASQGIAGWTFGQARRNDL
jgi:hypothetical protein